MAINFSSKHMQITKSNSKVVLILAASSALVVFALISAKGLMGEIAYQRRVVNEKNKTVKQLQENIKAVNSLVDQYKIFSTQDTNILGGSKNGIGPKDGDNARIVLDALPSKYDYPGLASSVERMVTKRNIALEGIDGIDQEIEQSGNVSSPNPQPIEMNLELGAVSGYPSIQDLVKDFYYSIRPFKVNSIKLTAEEGGLMHLNASLTTYYQPTKNLSVDQREIK